MPIVIYHNPRCSKSRQTLQILQENGIEVYVMTAASEEIVRMIASDPKYGYNVKPENVMLRGQHARVADFGSLRKSSCQCILASVSWQTSAIV